MSARALILAFLAVLMAAPVAAQDAPRAWEGVWKGTVGTYPVVVCLSRDGAGRGRGAYYYLSRKQPLHLDPGEREGSWLEEAAEHRNAPQWSISPVGSAALTGTWSDGGSRTLPVTLARVAYEADTDPCGSTAFIAPRLGPVRRTSKPAKGYDIVAWDVGPQFADVSIEGFALRPELPGDAAINRKAAVDPLAADGPADFVGCMKGSLESSGRDGSFDFAQVPTKVRGDYLSVEQTNGYDCGGVHPDAFTVYRTFDRRTGEEIALWSWLARSATGEQADDTRMLSKPLRTLVLRRMRPVGDCREAVLAAEYWRIGLADDGLRFSPSLPHVVAACADDAVVPWQALAPMLSATGKAAMQRIVAAR